MLTARFAKRSPDGYPMSRYVRFTLHNDAGEHVGRVAVSISERASSGLMTACGATSETVTYRALARYGIRRIEALANDPQGRRELLAPDGARWSLDFDDVDELARLATTKRCDYQREEGRDLFCVASYKGDRMAKDSSGLRTIAYTSRLLCNACGLPDSLELCSHLLHPSVGSKHLGHPADMRRDVEAAICDIGRDEISSPSGCRPGVHPCWERVIRDRRPSLVDLPPVMLSDAFDALDTSWRRVMGDKRRLLKLTSATTAMGLGQPVTDRESFRGRVDDLGAVINDLHVDRALLPNGADHNGSLNKLAAAIENRVDTPIDVGEIVTPLRHIVALRVALTHPGAAKRALGGAMALGFDWPPTDWRGAWNRVQVVAVDALRDLRRVLDAIEADQ